LAVEKPRATIFPPEQIIEMVEREGEGREIRMQAEAHPAPAG
jgi:hypothetical protein